MDKKKPVAFTNSLNTATFTTSSYTFAFPPPPPAPGSPLLADMPSVVFATATDKKKISASAKKKKVPVDHPGRAYVCSACGRLHDSWSSIEPERTCCLVASVLVDKASVITDQSRVVFARAVRL